MPLSRHLLSLLLLVAGLTARGPLLAQPGFDLDIKKPEPYTERELRAERTGDKKLKGSKRFFQNVTTHYNYFFNAQTKLDEILSRARAAHKDNYARLLPFYPYTLEGTAADRQQLDSVIFKAQTGIVLHDLRSDWIDDLYLLWGQAYFLRKDLDSAATLFQFINHAFAAKEADGYYRYIGSRLDGGSAVSIVTPETAGLLKRMVSDPPSRNTAFLWQVRTLLEQGRRPSAAALLSTLRADPLFPGRLLPELHGLQAYYYYQGGQWDSAAVHLEQSFETATDKASLARMEFLAAQLYALARRKEPAARLFGLASRHTPDPVMDIYARLHLVRLGGTEGEDPVAAGLSGLLGMARRERYADYRDVIYLMAAEMELERAGRAPARDHLLQAARFSAPGAPARKRAYLQFADLAYEDKLYEDAARFYDSIPLEDLEGNDLKRVEGRKSALQPLIAELAVIDRQDSLQKLAALPEGEREALLRRQLRALRRAQGLEEEVAPSAGRAPAATDAPDLFRPAGNARDEWYFYNSTLKTSGAAAFAQTWGSRPNVDNWRRFTDVSAGLRATLPSDPRGGTVSPEAAAAPLLTIEALRASLPLTEPQRAASDDSIRRALLRSAELFIDGMEDYPSAIEALEALRRRFPSDPQMPQVLIRLEQAYRATGREAEGAKARDELMSRYGGTEAAGRLAGAPLRAAAEGEATKAYEAVYDLFIEGKFSEALAAKKAADVRFGTNKWSSQLLYIESVYHIQRREDSAAIPLLQTLSARGATDPLSEKAARLLDVLGRRAQIEDELRRLSIERPQEEAPVVAAAPPRPEPAQVQAPRDTVAVIPAVEDRPGPTGSRTATIGPVTKEKAVVSAPPAARGDSAARAPIVNPALRTYVHLPESPHYVVVVLNKVDNVFGNEARNAFIRYNKEKWYNTPLELQLQPLGPDDRLLLIGEFATAALAINYVQKASVAAPREIVPWLKAERYSFTILSAANLPLLQEKADLPAYRRFLESHVTEKW